MEIVVFALEYHAGLHLSYDHMAVLVDVLGKVVRGHHADHIDPIVADLGQEVEAASYAYLQCAESSLEVLRQFGVVVVADLDLEVVLAGAHPIAQVAHWEQQRRIDSDEVRRPVDHLDLHLRFQTDHFSAMPSVP